MTLLAFAAADIKTTLAEFEKIKAIITDIAPKLKAFDEHLDKGTFGKLGNAERLPLQEAEMARGVAIKKLEELSKALEASNPKSPIHGDFEAQKKLVEYYLFFEPFNSGIDLCNNLRPVFEKYVSTMNAKGEKVDQRILDCQNFEKEEGSHLLQDAPQNPKKNAKASP